ncbi:diguanylate cyclase (GGDEF)-like protein [Kribbella sp. VKM Ac-2527]|uniref:Diguanylate cyclase (GGDEF)-like protein n=1 Tax=Kribbella caucasensis TaxID=2512215 RepID=A0A4R6J7A9_9ACTN|nr:GGDEF domain-containing protein [Kribbella sp. VKM Ac-2527]TDO30195.1 diguanylate cyclase (GGDEF)-like protein [Kribbella sp. VKM Ac-2527]
MILIGRSNWVPPRQWKLWSLPRPALSYVLGVDAVALAITALAVASTTFGDRPGIRPTEWVAFAVLAVASVLHLESARGIERRREMAANTSPYTNLKSLWVFAGLLLLPLSLVVALVAISYGYSWIRVYGRTIAHRKIFSAATFILASAAAAAVLRAGGLLTEPRVPTGPWSLMIVVAAAATWWLVNFALVIGAILLSSPDATARGALGDLADQVVVIAGLGLGVAVGALQASYPWVVPILMVTVLCLHRDLLLPQFQRAAGTDSKTGLATSSYWANAVPAELARAEALRSTVGLLMLDLDKFKEINDTYGHPAGDRALKAVGETVRAEVRQGDLVARVGGDELAVLLPGASEREVLEVAERIRDKLSALTVTVDTQTTNTAVITGVPASFGAAVYPDVAGTMDQLVLAADNALLTAKRAGRNTIVSARPNPPLDRAETPIEN